MEFIATAHNVISYTQWSCYFVYLWAFAVGVSHILHACRVYLTNCKTCFEQAAVCLAISLSSEFLLALATLTFHGASIFALTAHLRNLDAQIISLIQWLCSTVKILLHKYFRKYGIQNSIWDALAHNTRYTKSWDKKHR